MSATESSYTPTTSGQESHGTLGVQDLVYGDTQTLLLAGELDIASAPLLEEALNTMGGGTSRMALVVDLGNVTFIDSTGLAAILRVRDFCTSADREFQIIRVSPQVERVFEITGLENLLRTKVERGLLRSTLPRYSSTQSRDETPKPAPGPGPGDPGP